MAITINQGQQLDLTMSQGVQTDYTFTSLHPSKATVNASGRVTTVASGLAVIVIRRNSDNKVIDTINLHIKDPDDIVDTNAVVAGGAVSAAARNLANGTTYTVSTVHQNANGPGFTLGRNFSSVAAGNDGVIYASEEWSDGVINGRIFKIEAGVQTLLAGGGSDVNSLDPSLIRFETPAKLTYDYVNGVLYILSKGKLYSMVGSTLTLLYNSIQTFSSTPFFDRANGRIWCAMRHIIGYWDIAGGSWVQVRDPEDVFAVYALAVASNGEIYFVRSNDASVYKYNVGTDTESVFYNGFTSVRAGLTIDSQDHILIGAYSQNNIHLFDTAGNGTRIAGSAAGTAGIADGALNTNTMYRPTGFSIDEDGNLLFVHDFANNAAWHTIRKITIS